MSTESYEDPAPAPAPAPRMTTSTSACSLLPSYGDTATGKTKDPWLVLDKGLISGTFKGDSLQRILIGPVYNNGLCRWARDVALLRFPVPAFPQSPTCPLNRHVHDLGDDRTACRCRDIDPHRFDGGAASASLESNPAFCARSNPNLEPLGSETSSNWIKDSDVPFRAAWPIKQYVFADRSRIANRDLLLARCEARCPSRKVGRGSLIPPGKPGHQPSRRYQTHPFFWQAHTESWHKGRGSYKDAISLARQTEKTKLIRQSFRPCFSLI